MRGHVPIQPPSSRPASLHGHWGQSCAASRHSGAPQPCALAAAFGLQRASETVETVVDRRALLATNAAADRPAGGEVDGGEHCRDLLALGPAGRDADGETRLWRDTDETRQRKGGRSEGEGQGRAVMSRLHAGAVGLAGGGNGAPLTSGRHCKSRPHRARADLGFLRSARCAGTVRARPIGNGECDGDAPLKPT